MEITLVPVTGRDSLSTGGLTFRGSQPEIVGDTIPFEEASPSICPPEGRGAAIVMDVDGLRRRDISERALKGMRVKRCDVWFLTSIERVDDVLDAFSTDAEKLMIPYHTTVSDQVLSEALELSDSCLPAVFSASGSAFARKGSEPLDNVLSRLEGMGYRKTAVLDTDGSMGPEEWDALSQYGVVPYSRGRGPVPGFTDCIVDFSPGTRSL